MDYMLINKCKQFEMNNLSFDKNQFHNFDSARTGMKFLKTNVFRQQVLLIYHLRNAISAPEIFRAS